MPAYIINMKKEIREKTAHFIAFELFLLVFVLVEVKILPENTIQNLSLLSGIFIAGLSILTFIGDIYYWLDKWLGRICKYNRQKIDQYIVNELTSICKQKKCPIHEKITKDTKLRKKDFDEIMALFYKFIPPEHTERERNFAYFTDYYLSLNYSAISLIFFVGVFYILHATQGSLIPSDPLLQGILIIYGAVSLLSFISCYRYSSKLIDPTKEEVREILTEKKQKLMRKLPQYRVCCVEHEKFIHCIEAKTIKCPLNDE